MALQKNDIDLISKQLVGWVEDVAKKTRPDRVVWCDGSEEEYQSLVRQMLNEGLLIELDQDKFRNCYLHRSNVNDVARTEASTYICTAQKEDVGPTNNWLQEDEAETLLWKIFSGCMKGRTMYVVPYVMGPVRSPYSQAGVEITDSPYVAASLRIMTRMGRVALDRLNAGDMVVRGVHSQGTMDPNQRYICHFPDEKLIMSINSNYGGNALLSKKSHSLRLASVSARNEGWLAEHMLIVGVEEPSGDITYVTGAFPSASGKTNLAMLRPPAALSGFKMWTIGDDIAWLHFSKEDGRLHAINPEAGFFCVAPGTSPKTNPNLMETIKQDTIFTNVALTSERTPWWEGMPPPAVSTTIYDWQGRVWQPGSGTAAHPNSRFTASIHQYPHLSSKAEDPDGVPVSAMIFGGRRTDLVPLVCESLSWEHGVLIGAMMKVETTAAAEGAVGRLRNDPMAMIPFCGYNMGDYFQHWLDIGKKGKILPRIFQVNWFRKGGKDKSEFLWPGFSENIRVMRWIADRVRGKAKAVETPIGNVPAPGSLDLTGLNVSEDTMRELLYVDREKWLMEVQSSEPFFKSFGGRFPSSLWEEYRKLLGRLQTS